MRENGVAFRRLRHTSLTHRREVMCLVEARTICMKIMCVMFVEKSSFTRAVEDNAASFVQTKMTTAEPDQRKEYKRRK